MITLSLYSSIYWPPLNTYLTPLCHNHELELHTYFSDSPPPTAHISSTITVKKIKEILVTNSHDNKLIQSSLIGRIQITNYLWCVPIKSNSCLIITQVHLPTANRARTNNLENLATGAHENESIITQVPPPPTTNTPNTLSEKTAETTYKLTPTTTRGLSSASSTTSNPIYKFYFFQ